MVTTGGALAVVLLVGKFLLLVLLYLFLVAAVRTGIGSVSRAGASRVEGGIVLVVTRGPRELAGVKVPVDGPIIIGRSPGADIVIGDDFISSSHARVYPSGDAAIVEDLGSTNGTVVNGKRIGGPVEVHPGDDIELGAVVLKVARS